MNTDLETTYSDWVKKICSQSSSHSTFIVGIAGTPGAGKTTAAEELCRRLNVLQDPRFAAICVPMDGFHLYRHDLDQMKDAKRAHERRGSPFTFDSKRFGELLLHVRSRDADEVILAPSFDHKKGDPVEEDIVIEPRHRIILVEGNYLYLRTEKKSHAQDSEYVWYWHEIDLDLFDVRAYIPVDIDRAMERVHRRHLTTGLTDEQARARIEKNDRPNAVKIMETLPLSTTVIHLLDR